MIIIIGQIVYLVAILSTLLGMLSYRVGQETRHVMRPIHRAVLVTVWLSTATYLFGIGIIGLTGELATLTSVGFLSGGLIAASIGEGLRRGAFNG